MIEQRIYTALKSSGCNPYWPGQHKGQCKENYVVIKGPAGDAASKIGKNDILDLILFAPRPELSDGQRASIVPLLEFKQAIINVITSLGYKFAHDTPVIPDDEVMAYSCSLQYQIYRRR
jgi:hypothetical protein